jgi:hypothetical protein
MSCWQWVVCMVLVLSVDARSAAAAVVVDDMALALRNAELRLAIAEAERAEWLARIPPGAAKPLAGSVDTSRAGVVALMKSVDVANELARELCTALPARKVALYDAASSQGIVAARMVDDGLLHMTEQLGRHNQQLQRVIQRHTPPGSRPAALAPLVALGAIPATIKSAADIAALFKSDVTLSGVAYGDGARALFASALFKACPQRITGLGAGYLGELDTTVHAALLARVRALAALRGEFANQIAVADALADAAKGAEKRLLAASVTHAGALLKTVDAFIDRQESAVQRGAVSRLRRAHPRRTAARYRPAPRRRHHRQKWAVHRRKGACCRGCHPLVQAACARRHPAASRRAAAHHGPGRARTARRATVPLALTPCRRCA